MSSRGLICIVFNGRRFRFSRRSRDPNGGRTSKGVQDTEVGGLSLKIHVPDASCASVSAGFAREGGDPGVLG